MANHKSALKRHRQSLKARDRNRAMKTKIKNVVKEVRAAVDAGDKEKAQSALRSATSILDRAATKKTIHWRNAARKVSRLNKAVNSIQA